jgi:hypothetical protein
LAIGNWQSAIGNRQLAIGNRQLAIGNWQSAIGNWQSAIVLICGYSCDCMVDRRPRCFHARNRRIFLTMIEKTPPDLAENNQKSPIRSN